MESQRQEILQSVQQYLAEFLEAEENQSPQIDVLRLEELGDGEKEVGRFFGRQLLSLIQHVQYFRRYWHAFSDIDGSFVEDASLLEDDGAIEIGVRVGGGLVVLLLSPFTAAERHFFPKTKTTKFIMNIRA